jgi:hypothetical protein
MAKLKKPVFDMYRFQIVPTAKSFQLPLIQDELLNGIESMVDLIKNKNEILSKILLNDQLKFFSGSKRIVHKTLQFSNNEMVGFKMGKEKTDQVETATLELVTIERYPQFNVLFDLDSNSQVVLIQQAYKAQSSTESVANALSRSLNRALKNIQLQISIQPIYEQDELSKILEEYQGKIRSLSFHFMRPNMAALSDELSEGIKEYMKDLNSSQAVLKTDAPADGVLDIAKENPTLVGLNKYCSKGGGYAAVRVKNKRKSIKTGKTKKTVDVEIEIFDRELAIEILRGIIKEND